MYIIYPIYYMCVKKVFAVRKEYIFNSHVMYLLFSLVRMKKDKAMLLSTRYMYIYANICTYIYYPLCVHICINTIYSKNEITS